MPPTKRKPTEHATAAAATLKRARSNKTGTSGSTPPTKEKGTRAKAGNKAKGKGPSTVVSSDGDNSYGGGGSATAAAPKRNTQGQLVFPDFPSEEP